MERDSPILILAAPRSGSTWIGRVLGRCDEARYVHEPDNETHHPFALRAKRGLGRFPDLERDAAAPGYERCWEGAFRGGVWSRRDERLRRLLVRGSYERVEAWCDPGRRPPATLRAIAALATPLRPGGARPVVKSVHALHCADWLVERWRPLVVLVRRQALNVVASWRAASHGNQRESSLEYSGRVQPPAAPGLPPRPSERLEALAWSVGVLLTQRARLAERGDVVVVDHDRVCRSPRAELSSTARLLGLSWGEACDRELARSEGPGHGFTVRRIAAEQPGRWRSRLSGDEVERVTDVLAQFPGGPWFGSPAP